VRNRKAEGKLAHAQGSHNKRGDLLKAAKGAEEEDAALKIQTMARARASKNRVRERRNQTSAATSLQRVQRGKMGRERVKELKAAELGAVGAPSFPGYSAEHEEAATKIQAIQRRKAAKGRVALKREELAKIGAPPMPAGDHHDHEEDEDSGHRHRDFSSELSMSTRAVHTLERAELGEELTGKELGAAGRARIRSKNPLAEQQVVSKRRRSVNPLGASTLHSTDTEMEVALNQYNQEQEAAAMKIQAIQRGKSGRQVANLKGSMMSRKAERAAYERPTRIRSKKSFDEMENEEREMNLLTRKVRSSGPWWLAVSGAPGSGKGQMVSALAEALGVVHVTTAMAIAQCVKDNTLVGSECAELIGNGKTVGSGLMMKALIERLRKPDITAYGVILDGFPRAVEQIKACVEAQLPLDKVIVCGVDDEEMVKHRGSRYLDPVELTFHWKGSEEYNRLSPEVIQRLTQRDDDTEEEVMKGLKAFNELEAGIMEGYGSLAMKIDAGPQVAKAVLLKAALEALDETQAIPSPLRSPRSPEEDAAALKIQSLHRKKAATQVVSTKREAKAAALEAAARKAQVKAHRPDPVPRSPVRAATAMQVSNGEYGGEVPQQRQADPRGDSGYQERSRSVDMPSGVAQWGDAGWGPGLRSGSKSALAPIGQGYRVDPVELEMMKSWQVMRYEEVTRVLHEMGITGTKKKKKKFRKQKATEQDWRPNGMILQEKQSWDEAFQYNEIPDVNDMGHMDQTTDKVYRDSHAEKIQLSTAPKSDRREDYRNLPPRVNVPIAKRKMRMTPLPRVSRQAAHAAPTVMVYSFNKTKARVVVQWQLCWSEFLEYVTDLLGSDIAIQHLYTADDKEIYTTGEIQDGMALYTAKQIALYNQQAKTGLNRANSPKKLMEPLMSPDRYKQMCRAAEKRARRPAPPKIVVRSNHWTTVPPPSRFAKTLLVTGTMNQLLDEITKALELPNSCQHIYHADDTPVLGVHDIKSGENIYTIRKALTFGDRDWGLTLCPKKRKNVVCHLNHWSDAPPPSRYTQNVLVPDNMDLLCMKITDKMKTNGPVVRLFDQEGVQITDVVMIRDNQDVYLSPPPEKMKLSKRDWGKSLCPPKKRMLTVHDNRDPGDRGCYVPVIARCSDEKECHTIVLEEITRRLKMGMMIRKMYDIDGNVVTDIRQWKDKCDYYTLPLEGGPAAPTSPSAPGTRPTSPAATVPLN